jgi:hypothetical protein
VVLLWSIFCVRLSSDRHPTHTHTHTHPGTAHAHKRMTGLPIRYAVLLEYERWLSECQRLA